MAPSAEGPVVLRGAHRPGYRALAASAVRRRAPACHGAGASRGRPGAPSTWSARRGRAARFLTVAASGAHAREVRGRRGQRGSDRSAVGRTEWTGTSPVPTAGTSRGAARPSKLRGVRRASRDPAAAGGSQPRRAGARSRGVRRMPTTVEQVEPLVLDYEDQYRRSEEPYPGPEEFSATAAAAWGEGQLHLLIDVRTPEPSCSGPATPRRCGSTTSRTTSTATASRSTSSRRAGPVYGLLVVPDIGGARNPRQPAPAAPPGRRGMVRGTLAAEGRGLRGRADGRAFRAGSRIRGTRSGSTCS